MKLRFWGVRGSTPTPSAENFRYGGNTSCVEVRTAQGEIIVFDCGTGLRMLGKQLLNEFGHRSLQAHVFLSHYHWDHIQGIPFFEPLYNPENDFHFHSFAGHDQSVQQLLAAQMAAPYFPVRMNQMEAKRQFHDVASETFRFKEAVLKTVPLNHPQGCLGFRLESGGRVMAYATDNEPGSPEHDRNVRKLAEGADVLIYDGQYTPYEYANFKKGWGHSTWREAVNIANDAQVKQLILFHHDPDHSDNFVDSIVSEARRFLPNVIAAWEGLELDLRLDQHVQSPDPANTRLGSREPFQVPLVVMGKSKDGVSFEERTTLENLSIRGAYFLLDNDPDPQATLEVEFHGDPTSGRPLTGPIRSLKSQMIRKYPIECPDKVKQGIAVVFR